MMANIPKGSGYFHLLNAPCPKRPEPPEPDPRRVRLFAVEASVSDARRALARARRFETGHRIEITTLEDLVALLAAQLLREANGQ